MKEKENIDPLIVTINGKPYLIFPEALDFVGGDRSVLHQRIIRGTVEGVEKRRKYVFIPLSYCEKMKKELETKDTMKALKEADSSKLEVFQKMMAMDITLDDLALLQKNKESKKK
ncbi:MAG: hypothetical protein NTU98_07910 [Bacteroidetes bacterium]|nr:hypothetical protein [Bacteroidota bacterium]